jgi:hypothetical protein
MIRSQEYKKLTEDMADYEPLKLLLLDQFSFVKSELLDLQKKY